MLTISGPLSENIHLCSSRGSSKEKNCKRDTPFPLQHFCAINFLPIFYLHYLFENTIVGIVKVYFIYANKALINFSKS